MIEWDEIMSTQRQAKYPAESFVRFVARNYYKATDHSKVHFLDVGCGAGANSWYLAHEGFRVTALDGSASALAFLKRRFHYEGFNANVAYVHDNVLHWNFPQSKFNCILDHNSLCHVEKPPLEKIRDALVTNGKFFSVAPSDDTWRGTLMGKGFCRVATRKQIEELYSCFGEVHIASGSYPDGNHVIKSWVIECVK